MQNLSCENEFDLHKGSLRAGHQANRPAVRMILSAWFDHLQESCSYIVLQFKTFCPPVKSSCPPAKNV